MVRALPSLRGVLLAALLSALSLPAGLAADPQPYDVTLKPTGKSALDGALTDSSSLISLREKAPVGGFALTQRAAQDVERFRAALHSFGYYKARVDLTIAGKALDDPRLPGLIDDMPAQPPVPVTISFELGPQFRLGNISLLGTVPPSAAAALDLHSGDPAIASDVLAAQGRLLTALRDASYPLAKVELQPATLRLPDNRLDLAFDLQPGPKADFGPIAITGLKDMNKSFVRRRLLLHQGEPFSPTALEDARTDLMKLGVFSSVRMDPASQLNPQGNLPITVQVAERPLHAVDVGVAYSTDLGVNLNTGWHHRNLFGNAEQLNLTGSVSLGGNATTKPGYLFGAQFLKPDFLARNQELELDLGAVKQSLKAYDQRALTQKIAINRKFPPYWSLSVGVSGEQEEITQEGVGRHYNLIGLPVTLKFDDTNSLLDPTHGIRAAFTLTPTHSIGTKSTSFLIAQASGSTYLDLSGNGRSVVALRGLIGKIAVGSAFDLPPDQRFYAGGSGTVRGYRYQSVGPRFPDNLPTGGTAVSAGSVELRQRVFDKFGVVGFVDAGQVNANGAPLTSNWRVGAGVGARYYTSIGPIRLDVAVPLNKQPGGDTFELYIGIGQAF